MKMETPPKIPRKPVPHRSSTGGIEGLPPTLPYISHREAINSSQEILQDYGEDTTQRPTNRNRRSNSGSIVSVLTSDSAQFEEPFQNLGSNGEEQATQALQHQQSDKVNNVSQLSVKATSSSGFSEDGDYKYWNPVYLHVWNLLAYTFCLMVIATALIVLLQVSKKNHGLSTAKSGYNYAWTYGPTAVFVVLSIPWKRIDHLCKILTPWQNMKQGPQTALRSTFLDTISPTLPEGIASAIRFRHWPLLSTNIGTLSLSLMTVFSTGLFALRPTELVRSNVVMQTISFWNSSQFITDGSAATSYYGIHNAGLPYPTWTLDYAAVQPFSTIEGDKSLNVSSITASVLVFYPAFKCEEARWNGSRVDYTSSTYDATFTTDTCTVTQSLWAIDGTQLFTFQSSGFPPDNYASTFQPISCLDDDILDHVLLTVSHATEGNEEIVVTDIGAVICQPDYSISTTRVTFFPQNSTRGQSLELDSDVDGEKLSISGLSPSDLSDMVSSSSSSFFIQSTDTDDISETSNPFFTLMGHSIGPILGNSTLKPLLDAKVLSTQAEKVFVGIAAQLASQSLLAPRISNITGEVRYEDNRLHVQQVTVILLVVLLGLLILSTAAVIMTRAVNVVPRNPATIGGLLILLRRSEGLQGLLRGTGILSLGALKNVLDDCSYRTKVAMDSGERKFLIDVETVEREVQEVKQSQQIPADKWWQPMGTLLWFKLLSLALPAILFITLEIIQQISDRRSGFVAIASNASNTTYGTKYIPAAIMFIVSLLHGTLYSIAAIFAPYQASKRPGNSASRTITVDHMRTLPVLTILNAARIRHWAVFATSISVIISAFLTIFVADLYTINPVERTTAITLSRIDQFDLAWNNSYSFDNQAGSIGNLIEYWNITYPQWTYQDLAFPKISLLEDTLVRSQQDSIKLTVPAYRGVLNCSQTSADQTTVVVADTRFDPINITGTVADTCAGSKGQNIPYSIITSLPLQGSLFGAMDYMHFRENISLEVGEPGSGFVGGFQPPDNGPGCPSLAFGFGELLDEDTREASASTFTCAQLIQEVMTEVVFLLPSFSLDLNNPPITNESTARYVDDEVGNIVRECQHTATWAQYNYNGSSGNFFDAVLHGRDKDEPNQLLGASNIENLINASTRVYGRYMAQTISLNMRTSSGSPITIQGMLQQRDQLRLHQNKASKVALQICLGLMVCCAAAYWIIMDTKELLPRNPCSIASVASWLTGNSLWDSHRLLDNIEAASDKELLHSNHLGGSRFGFGWWDDAGENESEGVRRFGFDEKHS